MKPKNRDLAILVGFAPRRTLHGLAEGIDWSSGCYGYDECLEDLIQEVREQEREACAKLCDEARAARLAELIRGGTE